MYISGDVPAGPLSAFDINKNGTIFFEEKKNLLIFIPSNGEGRRSMTIHSDLFSDKFYWNRIVFVNEFNLLCLLKSHNSREYHLALLHLNFNTDSTLTLQTTNTQISTFGYQVSISKSSDDTYYLSLLSNQNVRKAKPPKVSTRMLFRRQASNESNNSLANNPRRSPRPSSEKNVTCTMLKVEITDGNTFSFCVVSIGQERFKQVKIEKPSMKSPTRNPFSVKYGARLTSAFVDEVFFFDNHVVYIDKTNTSEINFRSAVPHTETGVLSAIKCRIEDAIRSAQVSDDDGASVKSMKHYPKNAKIISNIEIVGKMLYFVSQGTSGDLVLHSLLLDSLNLTWISEKVPSDLADSVVENIHFRAFSIQSGNFVFSLRGHYTNERNADENIPFYFLWEKTS